MEESFHVTQRIPREDLLRLCRRSNGPGLVRIATQLGLLAATVALATVADATWQRVAAAALSGVVLASFFAPHHECSHLTAFSSRRLNQVIAWVASVPLFTSPAVYRELHWQHHRHTHDPEHDPEIALRPAMLGAWPRGVLGHLLTLSGVELLALRLLLTVFVAAGPNAGVCAKYLPYVRLELRRRCIWESRAVLVLDLLLIVAFGRAVGPLAVAVTVFVSHAALSFYLTPEHRGLPYEGTVLARTRSIDTNAIVRFFMWNMPFHAEHHAYPAVPFHALPRTRTLVRPELRHLARGYLRLFVRGGADR